MKFRVAILLAALLVVAPAAGAQGPPAKNVKISWKKTVVDKVFRSEGVAVADVNKDGKLDIIVGDVWYEAPNWKMHPLRKEKFKSHDPGAYSEAFAVFADDFNGDGYPDVIVIPFPGAACYWYENPKGKDELWKEHLLTNSACNETPIYVDLFKTGKKILVMGWNPPPSKDKKNGNGEVCYFLPGKDPTQPWERISISGDMGKHAPGSDRFYHGLGCGDVNGDGRDDIITPDGWWEQPEKSEGQPWKWHPTRIGQGCADMHVLGKNSAGLMDMVSSSAHGYGLWLHEQRPGNAFVTRDIFPPPPALAKEPAGFKFNKEEQALFTAVNKFRESKKRAPWSPDAMLCVAARKAVAGAESKEVPGELYARAESVERILGMLQEKKMDSLLHNPKCKIGVGASQGDYVLLVAEDKHFSLPGQTHALHYVDINGDGLKDLVTGRRWWAHGPNGDVSPADPAYLYWFDAKKDATGVTTFTPHMIDDDSGVGTQFEVIDINGDGLPDVVISNKKGVFIFEQVRTVIAEPAVPPGNAPNPKP